MTGYLLEGGAIKERIPSGYYVDFTALASDYGWERLPSLWRWRYSWPDIWWWEFQKTDGLPWYDSMQEVYAQAKLDEFFTYEQMIEVGDYPFLIALKGVPMPTNARLWWASVRP